MITAIGRLCEKCDGKCVICDSYVRPCTLVRICDECNYGSYQGRCVICGGPGVSDAYYCKECTIQEKDVRSFTVKTILDHNLLTNFTSIYNYREMVVRKLSIWVVQKQIYSTNEKNMVSSNDNRQSIGFISFNFLSNSIKQ